MSKSNIVLFIVCIILLIALFVTSSIDCNKPSIPNVIEVPYPVLKPYPVPAETLRIKGDTVYVDTSQVVNETDSSDVFVSEFDRTYKEKNDSVRVQSNVAFNTTTKVMKIYDELLTWFKAERPADSIIVPPMTEIKPSILDNFWVQLFLFIVTVLGWAL